MAEPTLPVTILEGDAGALNFDETLALFHNNFIYPDLTRTYLPSDFAPAGPATSTDTHVVAAAYSIFSSFTSGVAFEPDGLNDSIVYPVLTAGGAGTVAIAIGPTANLVILPAMAVASGAPPFIPVRVPASWQLKVTVTGSVTLSPNAYIIPC